MMNLHKLMMIREYNKSKMVCDKKKYTLLRIRIAYLIRAKKKNHKNEPRSSLKSCFR